MIDDRFPDESETLDSSEEPKAISSGKIEKIERKIEKIERRGERKAERKVEKVEKKTERKIEKKREKIKAKENSGE